MSKDKKEKFIFLESIAVIIILLILVVISTSEIYKFILESKNSVVKSNARIAESEIHVAFINKTDETINEIINDTVTELNNPDLLENSGDETVSPYSSKNNIIPGFSTENKAKAGQVLIYYEPNSEISVKGYGKDKLIIERIILLK
ncbi:MAG: hypothetical protein V2B14_03940 [bacterium]